VTRSHPAGIDHALAAAGAAFLNAHRQSWAHRNRAAEVAALAALPAAAADPAWRFAGAQMRGMPLKILATRGRGPSSRRREPRLAYRLYAARLAAQAGTGFARAPPVHRGRIWACRASVLEASSPAFRASLAISASSSDGRRMGERLVCDRSLWSAPTQIIPHGDWRNYLAAEPVPTPHFTVTLNRPELELRMKPRKSDSAVVPR